jgi:hypothetical protein
MFFFGHTFIYNFLKQVVCYIVGFNSFVSFIFFKSFRPKGIVYGSLISSSAPLVRKVNTINNHNNAIDR